MLIGNLRDLIKILVGNLRDPKKMISQNRHRVLLHHHLYKNC